MEQRSLLRNILVSLVMIGVVVLFIVFVFKMFSRGGSKPAEQINIGSYTSSNSEASLLVDGPTIVDENHRQVRITVSAIQTQVEVIQGYQGNVVDSRTYPNNESSYATFLQSLKILNFTKGDTTSKIDYRGYCPSGDRYVYTFNDGYKDIVNFWSTSCGQGTYHGGRLPTRQLFMRQIPTPDLNLLTRGIPLS